MILIMMVYGLAQVGSLMGMPIHTGSVISHFIWRHYTEDALKQPQREPDIRFQYCYQDHYRRYPSCDLRGTLVQKIPDRQHSPSRRVHQLRHVGHNVRSLARQFPAVLLCILRRCVLFAFVYIRTGKIIYTMILHASLNLVTSLDHSRICSPN